ncbi:MAG: MerR family transcriptional regulator [Clostridiales bacterium]|nr:MerR family transcriptional regulator [Clostridiales bacterium]
MYYKISTLANKFGITPQALRFYEKKGFLVPDRNNSSTRRYQARNLKWLCSIRRYHDLGFGIDEIQDLFEFQEVNELRTAMAEKEAQLCAQIQSIEKQIVALQQQQKDMERAERMLYECRLEESPHLALLINQDGQVLDETPETENLVREWMGELAYVYSASVVRKDAILRDDRTMPRQSGFCVEKKQADQLGLFLEPPAQSVFYPACIHTVTRLTDDHSLLGHVLPFARKQNLEITGDAVGRCLVKTGESNCRGGHDRIKPSAVYYEYWIPVREKIG